MDHQLNWGVVGCGVIANEMAQALETQGRHIYAVTNRTQEKAEAFAKKYGVTKVCASMDELFRDPDVDVVYLTTPHNTHAKYMRQAMEHGKHLLVEKSITLNSAELEEALALAEEKGLFVGEAMTIWHMPLYKELWRRVESGMYGKVQVITINFGSFKEYDMKNRFFNLDLAGGALLDIGVYALSVVRSFMSAQPTEVKSLWVPSPTGSDEMSAIALKNDAGQLATVMLSMHSKQPKRAMISLEKGYIEIMEFPRADRAFFVDAETGEREEILAGESEKALWYELSDMEEAILTGDPTLLRMDDTRDVMDLMTRLRAEWGLRYPEEE